MGYNLDIDTERVSDLEAKIQRGNACIFSKYGGIMF